jgi:hypothetical protein
MAAPRWEPEILLRILFQGFLRDFIINQPIAFHRMQSPGVRCATKSPSFTNPWLPALRPHVLRVSPPSHNVADRHVTPPCFQLLKHLTCLMIYPVSFSPPVLCARSAYSMRSHRRSKS